MYANQAQFSSDNAMLRALGIDSRKASLLDHRGQTISHPQTGGMLSPQKHELREGEILWRFASSEDDLKKSVLGGWWLASREFETLCNFAQHHDIHVAMAVRVLCCVPPEWSDMGRLLRVKVKTPLLAYKGLGNSVSFAHEDGLGDVNITAHNDIASRRIHQLFIPGLEQCAARTPDQVIPGALSLERVWEISKEQASQGWIYI